MNDPDLRALAELWQQPEPADTADFEVIVRRARRQARMMDYVDLALLVLIVGSTTLGAFLKPSPIAAVGAVLTIGVTIWLTWKRRAMRQMVKTLDTSDSPTYLESSLRVARANLRRVTFSIIAFPPSILTAIAFRLSIRDGVGREHLAAAFAAWAVSWHGVFALSVVAVLVVTLARSRFNTRRELRRLEELSRAYREEAIRDRDDGA